MQFIPQPSGDNKGGYRGEGIDVEAVLQELQEVSKKNGWHRDFLKGNNYQFLALRRAGLSAKINLYISAGIHGDEPAGPLAVLELLRLNKWPEFLNLWICPCLNPAGFQLNRRENASGTDLNRDYRNTQTEEIKAHKNWQAEQPALDIGLCLHEDWESRGFYVYELNPDNRPSLAPAIIHAVSAVCPIDASSTIDGWAAREGVIQPNKARMERPDWPEALHLISHKTRQNYTLEAPSDFPLPVRFKLWSQPSRRWCRRSKVKLNSSNAACAGSGDPAYKWQVRQPAKHFVIFLPRLGSALHPTAFELQT
jgi:murein peptide amidase A